MRALIMLTRVAGDGCLVFKRLGIAGLAVL
jgi:hypothetical protein